MNARCLVFALVAGFGATAAAADDTLDRLAQEAGLSVRQVKMVVGAHSGHAAYLASFDQVERQFIARVGAQRTRALQAHHAVPGRKAPEARVAQQDAPAPGPAG